MQIDVNEAYAFVLKKVYNPLILKTEEGNQLALCMRDDTIEMTVPGSGKHYQVNMVTGEIFKMYE